MKRRKRNLWRFCRYAIVACILVLHPQVAHYAQGSTADPDAVDSVEWKTIRQENGITVQRKEVPNSSIIMFRGMGVVDASVVELLATLGDIPSHPEWILNCIEARNVETRSPTERIYYGAIHTPWPLKNRDYVIRNLVYVDHKHKVVTLLGTETTHSGAPPHTDRVRMKFMRTKLVFKPQHEHQGRKTWVMLQVHADPAGLIPAWAVNIGSKNIPFKSIKNLESRARAGKHNKEIFEKYQKIYAKWY